MARPADDYAAVLRQFHFQRILNEDTLTHSVTLLGTLPSLAAPAAPPLSAIVRIEKTALPAQSPGKILSDGLRSVQLIEKNDIYSWLFGSLEPAPDRPDVKINVISPATEVHIRKYSTQRVLLVHETPALYDNIVKPYIAAFPKARTQWVVDILEGRSEADKVLHRDSSAEYGYVLLPDMKWDLATVSSLYLVAIASSPDIRSLRDLGKRHLDMLQSIRREAARVVREKWGLGPGSLRMYVHYQPSYYHFHVHIVNVDYQGLWGMSVGQAHLLDDIISLLQLDAPAGPSVFERMTLTYGLGEQHGLFAPMRDAQSEVEA